MVKLISITLVLASIPGVSWAQAPPPREFHARFAESAIVVDGRLDELWWQEATPIPVQYEIFPGDNAPARVETTCFVMFDASRLYFACHAADPDISALRANLADRDVPFQDDSVGLMIDTFNDGRRAFQFRVNARGVQMDAVNSDIDGSEDWSWDAIWDAKVQIGSAGYTAEIAIPFSSLRFPRESGAQTWGFMVTRNMPRSTQYRMRSIYSDSNRSCMVCQFDKLSGFTAIEPGRNLEFDPTVTMARTDLRAWPPQAGLAAGDLTAQAGLSARWSITPNVVLSGTVNPDFYQVEADAAQLDVNNRFQLFFPEKRPFFIEGSDFFQSPFTVVFTRTVADPHFGVKLTGKEGPHAFGFFVAQDSVTGIVFPGFEGSSFRGLEQNSVTSVLRYRRDVGGSGSTIGFLYAARQGDEYANRVGGVDGLARFSSADSLQFQWVGSHTGYPETVAAAAGQSIGAFRGQAFSVSYGHGTREWDWNARVSGTSPEFRADAGFVPQVGTRAYSAFASRVFLGGSARWFNEFSVGAGCDRTTDWDNSRASWGCDAPFTYSGPMQLSLSYNPAPNSEYYRGATYFNLRHVINASIRPSGSFSLNVSATPGGAIDFANARKANQLQWTVGGTYNLFGRLTGSLSRTTQSLEVAGGRLFNARLTQARVVYHLNVHTFVRAIVQYTDVTRDPALYLSPTAARTRRLFSQLLFSYKLNPQTVALVGYSDNADTAQTADLTRANRTFFMKVGYAWVQ